MTFMTCLPRSHGYNAILVVVDHLSKYCLLGALETRFNVNEVDALFLQIVIKHHDFCEYLLERVVSFEWH